MGISLKRAAQEKALKIDSLKEWLYNNQENQTNFKGARNG